MIDQAFSWIGQIAAWIGQFFPRWKVLEPASAALKVVGWSFRKRLRATRVKFQRDGIVWWWPATTELLVHPVARQANNLPTQTIETTDGKSYAIGCTVVYEIPDLERLLTSCFDPDDTIKDIATTAIHSAASLYSQQELRDAARSGKLDREMKSNAHASLKDYGVRVLKMQITDLVPVRAIRLMTSEPSDAGKLFTA